MLSVMRNGLLEITFASSRAYGDPFTEVDLDAIFTGPAGEERRVPAFFSGDNLWKVRFSPDRVGRYQFRTVCSDAANGSLHGQTGACEVLPYSGSNPLYLHGRLKASADHRHLEHADGTPFFWLGDTWWFGLCKRLGWPEGLQCLAADRVQKGFNVIQIVAGLYPDVPPTLDERGANEAGFPLSPDYATIKPAYFDNADLRIAYLAHAGLVPAIVGCWGYYLPVLGLEKMKRFWRYLVARWSAHPVVWILCGEATMPFYLSPTKEDDAKRQRDGWSQLAAYVREMDGHHNVITIHPTQYGHLQVNDPKLLDLDMLQTGHGGYDSLTNNIESVRTAAAHLPRLPVLVGEVNYEGILGHAWQDVQRFCFWTAILSGACGHTYGANGIWQVNEPGKPFGPSPHGHSWGNTPWQEAARLAGSAHVGLGAKLLRGLPWWRMEPHPEWVAEPWSRERPRGVHAAGIPGELRIIYHPNQWNPPKVLGLEKGITYAATYFDPATGERFPAGIAQPDADGTWVPPPVEVVHDWVLVLERTR
ncbi:MAG: DUF4038 domain-containing protein [Planctomycetota bacterium]|nr:DUF4038 domain-containing protein [Planctomycetota bacterium]